MQLGQQLDIRPSLRADVRLTYWHKQIVKLLGYNAADLAKCIAREAERNPCLEVESTGRAPTFSIEMLKDRSDDFRQDLKLQLAYEKDGPLLKAAYILISLLDKHGYLRDDLKDLAAACKCPVEQFAQALALVQGLEPAGIGARSLQECYLLQLKRAGRCGSDAWRLLSEAFEPLVKRDTKTILQRLSWDRERLEGAREELRQLAVHPVSDGGGEGAFVIPDAEIVESGQGFAVRLLEHALPAVGISQSYLQSSAQKANTKFANEGLFYARRFLYCLERRNQTLLEVLKIAVRRQQDFLRGGERSPLQMKEIAGQLGLHPSTLTHAVANKYVQLGGRVFPARMLFVNDGVQGVSKEQIKKILQEWIAKEDAQKPLSDQALADAFGVEGLSISRRAVTQYRREMNIAPAAGRRKNDND